MKILVLGDIHGNWKAANAVIKMVSEIVAFEAIFQAGDLGERFPGVKSWQPNTDVPIYWCDGNHDNFDAIEDGDFNPRLTYMPRGSVLEIGGRKVLFFGGATSIDRMWRIEGRDWWPQEAITEKQVSDCLDADHKNIDTIVSHDRPLNYHTKRMVKYKVEYGRSDRIALQSIVDKYRPTRHFYGHYHDIDMGTYDKCEFYCAPIIESMTAHIWDTETNRVGAVVFQ